MCIAIIMTINDLFSFQYGTVESKKPLNDNLQQGLRARLAHHPSTYKTP